MPLALRRVGAHRGLIYALPDFRQREKVTMVMVVMYKFFLSALIVGQIDGLIDSASKAGTLGMQAFVIFLLFVLGGVVLQQNRKADTKEVERAKREEERFNQIFEHHETLVKKIDLERADMNKERIARMDGMLLVIRENTTAMTQNAIATAKNTEVTENLSDLIRDRIQLPTHQSQRPPRNLPPSPIMGGTGLG